MNKKLMCWLLAFALVLVSGGDRLILPVGADIITDGVMDGSETITMMPDFTDDEVLVVLTHEASLQFIDYTLDDFPEIECVEISDLSTGKGAVVKAVLSGEQLRMDSIGARFMNQDIDIDGFRRILYIRLANPSKGNVLRAVAALEQRDDIYSAEPNYIIQVNEPEAAVSPTATETDYTWAADKIQLEDAWDIETGSNTVYVGILDSGIDDSHPELDNKVRNSLCVNYVNDGGSATSDPIGHGTAIAGIIAAKHNDDAVGFSGVCQLVRLVSLRVAGGLAGMRNADFINALNYARVNDIAILNISLGFSDTVEPTALHEAISNYDGLIVWGAGNSNRNYDEDDSAPSYWEHANVIVVGASTSSDTRCSFSDYGITAVDLFAPGDNVLSCIPYSLCPASNCTSSYHVHRGYHRTSGTSFAAPFVAGVAALIIARHSDATAATVKQVLINSVDSVSALRNLCLSGGRLNAYNAITSKFLHNDSTYTSVSALYHRVSCNDCDATWLEEHAERPGVETCVYCGEIL